MFFRRFDCLMCICNGLTRHVDTDEEPDMGVPARENAEPIPVPLDDTGFPELLPTPRGGVKLRSEERRVGKECA